MKKIININLSGRVIPIEDSAYEKLQQYIESLRRYFANEEGRDEIINDIESRIAELMSDKTSKSAAAIADEDVENIINSMGRVEDFEAADKEEALSAAAAGSSEKEQAESSYSEPPKKPRGRLYRDTNDKFIGGVCSGIAAYMNVDPSIVRILFGIISFGGFGFGFLAYIILWIVLPPKDLEGFVGKRLYRNPDDKVIGGVAGGLAAYFGKSARNIRLIFAAPLILSILISILNRVTYHDVDFYLNIGFGSLTGTFIITYVVLWIVLPEANSEYQKMEMRGETVDINRIRQNVREGMGNMKDRMKEWSNEVKSSAQNLGAKAKEFAGTRGKDFARDFGETTKRGGQGIGHAIGVLFKVFFLFIAGTIAFALFVAVIAMLFGGVAWWPVNNFLWTSDWQQALAWATLILFVIVPLIGFITWLIRRITRAKSKNNYLGWIFGGLWALGWIAMILFVSSLFRDFRQYEQADDEMITMTQPADGKLIVAVSQPELEYSGKFGWINDGSSGWDISDDTLKIGAVKFTVNASTDQQYHTIVRKYSFGKDRSEAKQRADKILFEVTSANGVLDIGNGYAIDKTSKFRGQNVEVEIRVPVGKKIRFDESVTRKLNAINIRVKRSYRKNRISGITIDNEEEAFHYRTGVDYTMSEGGILLGPGGESVTPQHSNDYRYNGNSSDTQSKEDIRKQLEEAIQKKKQDSIENEKRIKDLQEKAGKGAQGSVNKQKKNKETTKDYVFGPSPVSSISQWF